LLKAQPLRAEEELGCARLQRIGRLVEQASDDSLQA
jgi:hypothetical protein